MIPPVKKGYVQRAFFMSTELDSIVEQARKELGMNRSQFYRAAIYGYLERFSILTTKLEPVKEAIRNNAQKEVVA